jgi:chromosome segregation ATPase
MTDPLTAQTTAIKLAEISHEIEELESGRLSVLQRIEKLRSLLITSGNRTSTARASVDFLTEHLTEIAFAQVRLLEAEVREIANGLESLSQESATMTFETGSLDETISEVEDEIERISMIVLEGKSKTSRGH